MPKRIARLQSRLAIGMLALAPVWLSAPLLAGLVLYRRQRRQKRNES